MVGLHQAMAAAVDAYASARIAGHPVVTLIVGKALSGGFLAHGLQAQQILALNDPGVVIHAMHKPAAARVTLRTVDELDELAKTVPPLSYDVGDWAHARLLRRAAGRQDADAPDRRGRRSGAARRSTRRSPPPGTAHATCPTGSTPRRAVQNRNASRSDPRRHVRAMAGRRKA